MRVLANIAIGVMCTTIALSSARQTVTKPGETVTATATIKTIDAANRFVVLRDDDGSEVGVFAPPELTRFDELRTGDRVTFTYYESTVYRVKPPHAVKSGVREKVAAIEGAATLPSATFSHQSTERVTVKAVDRDAPSITVVTADRRIVSRKVENRSLLEGIKRGDRIDITYTQALLATVTRAK